MLVLAGFKLNRAIQLNSMQLDSIGSLNLTAARGESWLEILQRNRSIVNQLRIGLRTDRPFIVAPDPFSPEPSPLITDPSIVNSQLGLLNSARSDPSVIAGHFVELNRIISGVPFSRHEVVQLSFEYGKCSGTLLDATHVLTARHCACSIKGISAAQVRNVRKAQSDDRDWIPAKYVAAYQDQKKTVDDPCLMANVGGVLVSELHNGIVVPGVDFALYLLEVTHNKVRPKLHSSNYLCISISFWTRRCRYCWLGIHKGRSAKLPRYYLRRWSLCGSYYAVLWLFNSFWLHARKRVCCTIYD